MNKLEIVSSFDKECLSEMYLHYYDWRIDYIPLELISFKKWNESRYENNKMLILKTNSTMPITLIYEDNKYQLQDGNHRCFCAQELGYTHICAIILTWIEDDSFR